MKLLSIEQLEDYAIGKGYISFSDNLELRFQAKLAEALHNHKQGIISDYEEMEIFRNAIKKKEHERIKM